MLNGELMNWPADSVSRRALSELIPYARNARTHSPEQIAQLAASIREWGWTMPILVDEEGGVIAGHGRILAARQLGIEDAPCMVAAGWSEAKKRAYILADNKLALNAGWDEEALALELSEIEAMGFDQLLTGFSADEISALTVSAPAQYGEPDEIPETPDDPVTVVGDIWLLGNHRLMCGDSTDPDAVRRLMNGQKAALLHADPPYGMGKENDGIANDNLHRENLDAFQMSWWTVWRPHLDDNASAYIWGTAADLWRLWYCGGLSDSERMTIRNEIVWSKGTCIGIESDSHRMFPTASERCLFFMLGEQGFNNNADNYWEGWEPIRSWLDNERRRSGLTTDQCNKICGKQNMTQSAFTKGGFRLILEEDYNKLRAACNGDAFKREYDAFKREYDELKREYDELKQEFYATRAFFDNTHDNMTDVWEFKRVTGEDRHGHATPKPVAMMGRVMKSSLDDGGLCVEPFCGSGSTLIAAEETGRICYTMDVFKAYCDVTINRWQSFTGQSATLADDGRTFDEIAEERCAPPAEASGATG